MIFYKHFPDLSHFDDAVVDYHGVKAGGVPLVVLKATQGTSYVDPTFTAQADRIRSVPGLTLFSYAFEDAGKPPAAQMDFYLSTAHLKSGDGVPIIDAEQLGLTRLQVYAAVAQLKADGHARCWVYCSRSYYYHVLGAPLDLLIWIADYNADPPVMPAGCTVVAWQHTDKGTCPGVAAPCDMSYLTVPDLAPYLIP